MYEELREIYGDEISSDTPVQSQDLIRMNYLERVIKETLRLFPVGPVIARDVREDLEMGLSRVFRMSIITFQATNYNRFVFSIACRSTRPAERNRSPNSDYEASSLG